MVSAPPRRSLRLQALSRNQEVAAEARRNQLHRFAAIICFCCRPSELAARLTRYQSSNNRTDRRFRVERRNSSLLIRSIAMERSMLRLCDLHNQSATSSPRGQENRICAYHTVEIFYCRNRDYSSHCATYGRRFVATYDAYHRSLR